MGIFLSDHDGLKTKSNSTKSFNTIALDLAPRHRLGVLYAPLSRPKNQWSRLMTTEPWGVPISDSRPFHHHWDHFQDAGEPMCAGGWVREKPGCCWMEETMFSIDPNWFQSPGRGPTIIRRRTALRKCLEGKTALVRREWEKECGGGGYMGDGGGDISIRWPQGLPVPLLF